MLHGKGRHKRCILLSPHLLLLSYLRLQQVTLAGFIDDLITISRSFAEYERSIKLILTLSDSLGFVVHPDKSIFVTARLIEYLGFKINSQSMTIFLAQKKEETLRVVTISLSCSTLASL